MKKQLDKRDVMTGLGFLIHATQESLNLLCRINVIFKDYLVSPAIIKNWKDRLSSRDIAVCMSSLKSHICTMISKIFDDRKGTISFINTKSLQPKEIQEIIKKISREKIIKDIIKTRHTFIAHLDPNVQNIISIDQICQSNLKDLLEKLEGVYNLWLYINNVYPSQLF